MLELQQHKNILQYKMYNNPDEQLQYNEYKLIIQMNNFF